MGTTTRRDLLRSAAALGVGLGIGIGTAPPTAAGPETGAIEDLRRRLDGTVLLPGDPGFTAASAPANVRYRDVEPSVVAQCASENDVVTCIQWSQENGVPPVGRGGGHSYAGFSTNNGLVLDLSQLNSIDIDYSEGTAVVGGSASNGDLLDTMQDGPFFLPAGSCLGVCIGGFTLGGGIGYNTHWAGLTCDHLLSSRVVTASGELLEIDDSNHSDLFWAARGGAGGSFGIHTSFTFDLQQAPEEIAYYRLDWRGAEAATAVLSAFDLLMQTAPPAFNASTMAQATEVGDGGPSEAIDTFSRGQYIGPMDELRELVSPLLEAATPVKSTFEVMTFWDMQQLLARSETKPHSFGDYSRYVADPIPESAMSKMVELLTQCPSRTETSNGQLWSLGWTGGDVVNSIGRTETAYVHRDSKYLYRPTPEWSIDTPDSVAEELVAWTNEVIAVATPHTPNESYQNFPNLQIQDWQQQYYAENFERLVDIKTKYDDGNLFQNAQSIPPRRLVKRADAPSA